MPSVEKAQEQLAQATKERKERIIKARASGFTLEAIARLENITRERVRQIIAEK